MDSIQKPANQILTEGELLLHYETEAIKAKNMDWPYDSAADQWIGVDCKTVIEFIIEFRRLKESELTLLSANAELSFKKEVYKKALRKIVCLNVHMPDEVFNIANSALEELK